MGKKLTALFYEYMLIYTELDNAFVKNEKFREGIIDDINALKVKIFYYNAWVDASDRKPIDKLGGGLVRRKNMGDMLDYWTSLMISSVNTNKRIPDDANPLPFKRWW